MKKLTLIEKRKVLDYVVSKNRLKDYHSDSLWVTCAANVFEVSLTKYDTFSSFSVSIQLT